MRNSEVNTTIRQLKRLKSAKKRLFSFSFAPVWSYSSIRMWTKTTQHASDCCAMCSRIVRPLFFASLHCNALPLPQSETHKSGHAEVRCDQTDEDGANCSSIIEWIISSTACQVKLLWIKLFQPALTSRMGIVHARACVCARSAETEGGRRKLVFENERQIKSWENRIKYQRADVDTGSLHEVWQFRCKGWNSWWKRVFTTGQKHYGGCLMFSSF